jgi:hypothetical protein
MWVLTQIAPVHKSLPKTDTLRLERENYLGKYQWQLFLLLEFDPRKMEIPG